MTDSNTVEAPFRANEPFTANDYADLIVRSSDGHDFHVVKGILAMISTIFKDMLSLPQARVVQEPDVPRVLPVVDVTESGPVVDALLRYIYPGKEPEISSIDIAFDVLFAAQKYEMDRIFCNVEDTICTLRSTNDECILKSFAIACTHRLSGQTRASALASLRINLMDAVYLDALDNVSGKAVIRLFRYHAEVRQKLAKFFSGFGIPDDVATVISCHKCKMLMPVGGRSFSTSKWWGDMIRKAEQDVHTKGPMSADVFSQEKLRKAVLGACPACMPNILYCGVEKLYNSINATMRKIVSEVKFEIPWVE